MTVNYGGSRVERVSSAPIAAQGRPVNISGYESLANALHSVGSEIGATLKRKRENEIRLAAEESRLNQIMASLNTPEQILDSGQVASVDFNPVGEPVFSIKAASEEQIKRATQMRQEQIDREATSLAQFFTAQSQNVTEPISVPTPFGEFKVSGTRQVPLYSAEEALGLAKGIVSQPRQLRDNLINGAVQQKRLEVSGVQKAQLDAAKAQTDLARVQIEESLRRTRELDVEKERGAQRRTTAKEQYQALEDRRKRGEEITDKDLLDLATQVVIASSKESSSNAFLAALAGNTGEAVPGSEASDLSTEIFSVMQALKKKFSSPGSEGTAEPPPPEESLTPAQRTAKKLREAQERRESKGQK